MAPEPNVVRRATVTDLEPLAATFASAFANDPMIRWPMPDASASDLQALFRAILEPYLDIGIAWKVGANLAGAVWLPQNSWDQFAAIDDSTRAAIVHLTNDGGARYGAFWDWLDTHIPPHPCWYLDMIAVRPDAQGQGLGRALLEHGLGLARADGCPAFLETGNESNVTLYQYFGFQIVSREQAPDGGPTIWFMQT